MENLAVYILAIPVLIGLTVMALAFFGPENKELRRSDRAWENTLQNGKTVPKASAGMSSHLSSEDVAELKALTIAVKRGYTQRKLGGAIVMDKDSSKGLAIEYFGMQGGSDSIKVEFIRAPTLEQAKQFLRDETYESVPVESSVFEELKKVLLINSKPKRHVDVASGCIVYEGILP